MLASTEVDARIACAINNDGRRSRSRPQPPADDEGRSAAMRTHFITRLALLLTAGFLLVASQVWSGDPLRWLFVAGGAVLILGAAADSIRDHVGQRALDGLIALLGAWTIVEAFIFDGNDLKWWSFASAAALAALS